MSIFYVFQGETYSEERNGGYVWSPQFTKNGRRNAGYTTMTEICKGDFILHNSNGKIMAVSIVKADCYVSKQPRELSDARTSVDWNDEGYRVDTQYFDFDIPLFVTTCREWLETRYTDGSAFTTNGRGKQQYMCHLADEHAVFLLEQAVSLQKNNDTLSVLRATLSDIVSEKESEYSQVETELINDVVNDDTSSDNPVWCGIKETQAMTVSSNTGRDIPKRDPKRAAAALEHAAYLCEYNPNDRTFLRKSGKPYTEPHHLIPISRYRDFNYSVDIMENIISLCSHCHNLLHYGRFEDKVPLLEKLYEDRISALQTCGLDLTLEQLKSYYK